MLKNDFLLTATLTFITILLNASEYSIGTPFIINYQRSNYLAGSQTWDIQQGSNGMMYFANNDGLLEYDGTNWNIYKLPNNSIVRSIEKGRDGILYAGGYDELGYFEIGNMGGARYKSILNLLPHDLQDFGDVWKIYNHTDGVFFQTYNQLIIYKNDTVKVIKAPSLFHFSYMVNNEYYINDMELGLMRYAMGNLYPLNGMEQLKGKEIWGILPIENKLLIATASDGTYLYNGNSLVAIDSKSMSFLMKNQIYCTALLTKNQLAYGTIQNGLLITDLFGNPIQHINKEDGLQNNTILCIGQDFLGNVWLGTDHGIDYVELNSPLSQISYNYNVSTGYSAFIKNDRVYLGTNQGLFTRKNDGVNCNETKKMVLIEETRGQVWSLSEIGGTLFCGHNNGTYIIEDTIAHRICNIPGGWIFLQVPNNPNKIIGGTYTGLVLYSKENGAWKFDKQLYGFSQSSRKMEFDNDGTLWMTHGYKGIYHISFSSNYDSIVGIEFFNNRNSDIPDQVSGLAKIKDNILFTTNKGVLQYSNENGKFEINTEFNDFFNGKFIQAIKIDIKGNIWYFNDEDVGVLRYQEDGNYINISLPFKKLKGKFVSSFEFVYPYNDENIFFGTEKGFVHYNPKFSKNYSYEYQTYLISMNTFNPDSVYRSSYFAGKNISLVFENNSTEFVFSANDFENSGKILYSTYLKGNDKLWSNWDKRNTRTYTNLFEGSYTFRVKSRNIYGTITNEQSMSFKIKPPFLRSLAAYIIYAALFVIIILLIIFAIKKRFVRAKIRSEKKQQELFRKKEEQLQREGLEAEKEIIRMRNDKLREGMKLKDKELANSTMQMLHKNEMLITLRDELKKLANLIDSETHKHDVIRLVRGINKEIDNEKQWNVFETHFENVHEEFLKRIKLNYQDLTPRELKLCAYLRMNISSKEISVLMNISTRGVEISRYRLRKKLGIERDTNLTEFILSF